jgi:membrane-associated phospholipid phosphatase
MVMKKRLLLMAILFSTAIVYAQESSIPVQPIPLSKIFDNIGTNALHSITYNYGLNFIGAGLGTWVLIETGIDWQWNRLAYNNDRLARSGLPSLHIGYVVPAITPAAFYITGRFINNEKLQITGLALVQTLILTLSIQSILKMSTGREIPGIITKFDQTRSLRTDDFSGEFNWFNMNFIAGWPSGHTANAFSAAAVIAEIYKDNLPVKIAAYSYAALIGLGVSVNVHWASEVFAGALIGYAIGKTVGKSFNKLSGGNQNNKVSLYITPDSIGVKLCL